jgi:hypothetical protein
MDPQIHFHYGFLASHSISRTKFTSRKFRRQYAVSAIALIPRGRASVRNVFTSVVIV